MTIIEDLVASWGTDLLTWYAQTFMVLVSPDMLLVQVELLVLIYLVLQVIGFAFPVVKRLTRLIFLPFRVLHVWFHLDAANKLDLQTPDAEERLVITRFLTGVNNDDRASLGIKAPKNTRDAYRIATAPTKGALILIGLSFLISPILFIFGVVGFFIHLYILLGSLTTLWADGKDYLFVYQTAVLNADLSPRYLAWIVPVFSVSFLGTLITTSDPFRAFLAGISITVLYLLVLLWLVARISKQEKPQVVPEEEPTIETTALSPFPEISLPSLRSR
ncbi:MAG: hypothetical protein ACFFC7_21715 [Candidatus Hermodarchaeota archaeon]